VRCVVLISGRGSNLWSILENASHYSVAAVIADRDAPGLRYAREANIDCRTIPAEEIPGQTRLQRRVAQQAKIVTEIATCNPDFIVLAGFMQILLPFFISEFRQRILNIHPSLLPEFPGLNTHERVIALSQSKALREYPHGCTVHLVDEGVDTGQIIAQSRLMARADETVEALAARVLHLEHKLYPWVLTQLSRAEMTLSPLAFTALAEQRACECGFELGLPPESRQIT
jgi:phosphoribosylglycinamide formyltransferase-1